MPEVVSKLVEVFVYRDTAEGRKYLLLKRSSSEIYPGIWSVCSGSVEAGERAVDAAYRELLEETGLVPEVMFAVDTVNVFYEPLEDKMHLLPVFLARAGTDSVMLSEEHSEYIWAGAEESAELFHWISHKNNIRLIEKCLTDRKYFKTLKTVSKP